MEDNKKWKVKVHQTTPSACQKAPRLQHNCLIKGGNAKFWGSASAPSPLTLYSVIWKANRPIRRAGKRTEGSWPGPRVTQNYCQKDWLSPKSETPKENLDDWAGLPNMHGWKGQCSKWGTFGGRKENAKHIRSHDFGKLVVKGEVQRGKSEGPARQKITQS